MSCDNWESGTLKFSVAEFTRFKKAFREGFNELQDTELAAARRHWEQFKTGPLPDRHSEEVQRFYCLWRKWKPSTATQHAIDNNFGTWAPRSRPRKPIRKDYPLATNKQIEFNFDEASIAFDNKTREVHYFSGHNNRQVEEAREHPVGQLFFRLLESVNWTRGTGGQLLGNDEYNRDQTGEGGGGNYVTDVYGPKSTRGPRSLERLFRL